MTRNQAIAIRTSQLSGKPVDADELAQAIEVLRVPHRTRKQMGDVRSVVLETLLDGPIERDALYATVPRSRSSWGVIRRLRDSGLIRFEARLTEAGLRELGLQGPQT